ncbi:MAG TPA: hypothetical protein VLH60_00805, partial [Sedimentisphaerales bacterium]|nr:hypothetical protein [Sedimentisphaerales bacterium]
MKNIDEISVPQVLILDNDPAAIRVLLEVFARRGIRGIVLEPGCTARQTAEAAYEMVFCAIDESAAGDAIQNLKAFSPEQVVVAMLNSDSSSLAVAAMRAGYAEVIAKPLRAEIITEILDAFLPNQRVPLAAAGATEAGPFSIVGQSPQIRAAIET